MNAVNVFLAEFNKTHRVMKDKAGREGSFASLLNYLKNKNPVVKRYYDRLDLFCELRNLIVHEDYDADEDLVIPTQASIKELTIIRQKLEQPGQIGQYFKSRVVSLDFRDNLSRALDYIRLDNYSKFPVFKNYQLLGVIADKGILFFLSQYSQHSSLDMQAIKIADIISQCRPEEIFIHYKLYSPQTSIYELDQWFSQNLKNGRHHSIALMSQKDQIKQERDILGIITPFDLPKINAEL